MVMRIGIDISQTAYEGTGVSEYLTSLVNALIKVDRKNEYVLFFSSMRKDFPSSIFHLPFSERVKVKVFRLPPTLLDLMWNRLHIVPIEWLIGEVDVFISSDWTEPPTVKAKNATILYDLIVCKYPNETDKKIVETQKRRLEWVKKECDMIFCISESTKQDAIRTLGIDDNKLKVIYPGI